MSIWRFILEDYGTDIEYLKGEKNIVADALSIFLLNGNQDTTEGSTCKEEIMSEINKTK